jgi:hypothetical protein
VLLLAVAGAYAFERAYTPANGEPGSSIAVAEGSRVLRTFTMDDLRKLGVRRVVMQGKPETGPTLSSVLSAAGVHEFASVTIVGLGVRDSGRLTLARAAIDRNVLLDLANRGTAKVCGPDIPYDKRVRDVVRIEVTR